MHLQDHRHRQSETRKHGPTETRPADWMGWTFQLIAGLVGGFVLGFLVAAKKRGYTWLADGCLLPFSIGCALIVGAFASHYGDRMWLGNSDTYRIFPPTAPHQNTASVISSIIIGIVGLGFVGYAVLRTAGVL